MQNTQCQMVDLGIDNYFITETLLSYLYEKFTNLNGYNLVIVYGGTEYFCRGLDTSIIQKFDALYLEQLLMKFKEILIMISNCQIPVIAKVDGKIYGGGLGIISVVDIVIAKKNIELSLPETVLGLIPAIIFPFLCKRLSPAKAKFLSLATKPISGIEGYNIGLIDELDDDLENLLKRYVKRASKISPDACVEFKSIWNKYYGVKNNDYYTDAISAFLKLTNAESLKKNISDILGE